MTDIKEEIALFPHDILSKAVVRATEIAVSLKNEMEENGLAEMSDLPGRVALAQKEALVRMVKADESAALDYMVNSIIIEAFMQVGSMSLGLHPIFKKFLSAETAIEVLGEGTTSLMDTLSPPAHREATHSLNMVSNLLALVSAIGSLAVSDQDADAEEGKDTGDEKVIDFKSQKDKRKLH